MPLLAKERQREVRGDATMETRDLSDVVTRQIPRNADTLERLKVARRKCHPRRLLEESQAS